MSYASMKYREIRFVIEDELTHCYVHIEALGDCPLGVQGWHHKAFGASKSVADIVAQAFGSADAPVLWGQEPPTDHPYRSGYQAGGREGSVLPTGGVIGPSVDGRCARCHGTGKEPNGRDCDECNGAGTFVHHRPEIRNG